MKKLYAIVCMALLSLTAFLCIACNNTDTPRESAPVATTAVPDALRTHPITAPETEAVTPELTNPESQVSGTLEPMTTAIQTAVETPVASGTVRETDQEPDAETTASSPETEAETVDPALLVIEKADQCRVVYPYNATTTGSLNTSAKVLAKLATEKLGYTIGSSAARNGNANENKMILVGDMTFPEIEEVKATLPENGYTVAVKGNKIVILGSDENMTVLAMQAFYERILSNPTHVTDGTLTIHADDSFTVTDVPAMSLTDMLASGYQVSADYTKLFSSSAQGEYSIAQGAASDGTYVYLALRNSDDTGAIITKHRLDDGSLVATSGVLDLGHANDMTYNSKKNLLVVAHGQKEGKILTLVNPETLEFIEDANIAKGSGAITYNPVTNSYAISQGGKTLHMLNSELEYVTSYDRTKPSNYTAQGMGSDDTYIFFPMSGSGQNLLDIFDWLGNPVAQIILHCSLESESLFYVNGKHYVSFNSGGAILAEISFRIALTTDQFAS